jgi:hypothetical protein
MLCKITDRLLLAVWVMSETGFANAARTNQDNGGIIRKGSGVQGQQRGLRPLARRMHALRSINIYYAFLLIVH